MHQTPFVLWLTGLSGAGKTTIANLISCELSKRCYYNYIIDADAIRDGINKDLQFSVEDRNENVRRISEISYLMYDAGLIVIVSSISPLEKQRQYARKLFPAGQFIEVFVDTPLGICEARDIKGLYMLYRSGLIRDLTGFDSPYENPTNPEIRIDTTELSAERCADQILIYLNQRGLID